MVRNILLSWLICLSIVLNTSGALAEEAIGSITTIKGDTLVERSGSNLQANVGMLLYPSDTVKTAENGALGLVMHDDTLISMGPGSVLVLKEYQFAPAESRYRMILGFMKGTFVYISGEIGKLSPEAIRLETSESTIAVRGTQLLVKVNEGR